MGCFVAPVTEAVLTTVVRKSIDLSPKMRGKLEHNMFYQELPKLEKLLYAGSALLVFEHIYHGEVVPWYPFFTSMYSVEETAAMVQEILTTGILMCFLVTSAWICFVLCKKYMLKLKEHAHDSMV